MPVLPGDICRREPEPLVQGRARVWLAERVKRQEVEPSWLRSSEVSEEDASWLVVVEVMGAREGLRAVQAALGVPQSRVASADRAAER